jgi:hypothetical protein
MLEQQRLFLGPWSVSPPCDKRPLATAALRRPIWTHDQRAMLGFASWTRGWQSSWLRWLAPPVWDVLETEDESLLMTLHGDRFRPGHWEVLDSEPRFVGRIADRAISGCTGEVLATIRDDPVRIEDHRGFIIASFEPCRSGTVLSFSAVLEDEPFLKMLVLAAALTGTAG